MTSDIANYKFIMAWFLDIAIIIAMLIFLPAICLLLIKTFKRSGNDFEYRSLTAIVITGNFRFFYAVFTQQIYLGFGYFFTKNTVSISMAFGRISDRCHFPAFAVKNILECGKSVGRIACYTDFAFYNRIDYYRCNAIDSSYILYGEIRI